jgi:hypothetical protein
VFGKAAITTQNITVTRHPESGLQFPADKRARFRDRTGPLPERSLRHRDRHAAHQTVSCQRLPSKLLQVVRATPATVPREPEAALPGVGFANCAELSISRSGNAVGRPEATLPVVPFGRDTVPGLRSGKVRAISTII